MEYEFSDVCITLVQHLCSVSAHIWGSFSACAETRSNVCCCCYKYRWVEAKILAPTCLGTEGERSQWCNRLPEIVMISVANFVLFESVGKRKIVARKPHKRSYRA